MLRKFTLSLPSNGTVAIILEGHFLLCNANMVSFLFMIKSHLFYSYSRRLLRILKILVPGWFVAEVSEAQTVGVV